MGFWFTSLSLDNYAGDYRMIIGEHRMLLVKFPRIDSPHLQGWPK